MAAVALLLGGAAGACGSEAPTRAPKAAPSPSTEPTATPAPTPPLVPSATPSVLEQLASETGWFLFNVRRLEPPLEQVRVRAVSRVDGRRLLDRQLSGRGWRERMAGEQRLYAFMGLVPEGLDLYDLYLDLATEQSPAWHSPESAEIRLAPGSESIGVREALLLVYAYGFLIQEEHFGLSALKDEASVDRDRSLALESLSVGDASLSMALYGANRFPGTAPDVQVEARALGSAPFIVQQLFLFPHTFGTDFVVGLQGARGWEGVNAAYSDPPTSATEVLYPAKYLEGFSPTPVDLPDVADALGGGWVMDVGGVLGEFRLRIYLGSAVGGELALAAARGWSGDRYALLQGPAGWLLASRSIWESPQEAVEFFDGFAALTDARRAWDASEDDAAVRRWRAGDASVALGVRGSEVWFVIGPDDGTVALAAAAMSAE